MAIEVKVPPMGESITGGILATWRVQDGDMVERDQPLFELETDKVTAEGLADSAGRVSLKVPEGEEVAIGQVVAEIDETAVGEDASPGDEVDQPAEEGKGAQVEKTKPETEEQASPAVRRLGIELGIDPAQVKGSGKTGRVTKGDMLAAAERQERKPVETADMKQKTAPLEEIPQTPSHPTRPSEERTTRRKLTPLRQRIAERLVSAQKEAAILTTFNEVDLSAVRDLRARYQERFVKKNGVKLGFMSFFIKAVVEALREIPQLNVQLEGDSLIENHFYDIGVAVSSERGLMVPVIRDCDNLSMAELELKLADFAKKARDGKITIEDLQGGVFTISNGGVFGSLLSTPILNPPQSGILGMHTIQERPIAVNGEIVIRPMMYLALSYDHRVVDGREAVTFLVRIKQLLEDPARMLLSI